MHTLKASIDSHESIRHSPPTKKLARGRCRVHEPKETGVQVETGSGGLTKFNRTRLGVPKSHALDASCVGQVDAIHAWSRPTLQIKCTGRGSYQRTRLTQYGFARGYLMRTRSVKGFRTGDLVRASVAAGKKIGEYIGRVAVRASCSFNIQTVDAVVQGISHKYCRIVQRGDGYGYAWSIPNTKSLPSASTKLNTGKNNFPVSSRLLTGRLRLNVATQHASQGGGYPPEYLMIDTIFDLGGLAVEAASELAMDVASNLSGIHANDLVEFAGLHLTNLPRAWDLVAETLGKNLGGDDKGSADA